MSWVTVIWSMTAAVCLTLAALNLLVWYRRRTTWANLFFAVTAAATAATAAGEYWVMRSETPAEIGAAIRWGHLPVWLLILSLVGFVRLHLRTGRMWLAWTVVGVRTLSLILNFAFTPNLNFREITAVGRVRFLGEFVSFADGVRNPWMLVGQASLLLFVIFAVDATVTNWRRGDELRLRLLGLGMVFFTVASLGQLVLALWGIVPMPFTLSLFFVPIVLLMGLEMSNDVLRAAQLTDDLRESESRMTLAAEAVDFGVWIRNMVRNEIWASDGWRRLFGFTPEEPLNFDRVLQQLHPDDRSELQRTLETAGKGDGQYETEYRVVHPDGRVRWIASFGRIECNAGGQPILVRGVSVDITQRKLAEERAHSLSGRLIHAQEAERMRLARELHDDLSQSLALLSIELDLLGQKPPATGGEISGRMREFSGQVKALSSHVHRLSHELHPAKLTQLGLVAAVRGFCKEFGAAHQIAVEFSSHDMPRVLPDEIALCLYRIVQEGLQNVAKHSGAAAAQVALTATVSEFLLTVSDEGRGFDPAVAGASSLGLVSMRERVRLVHGEMAVHSGPGTGTRIDVWIPMDHGPRTTDH